MYIASLIRRNMMSLLREKAALLAIVSSYDTPPRAPAGKTFDRSRCRLQFSAMRDPRIEKLADVLVNYSVGVKKGQLVRITSSIEGLPLVNEVFRKVLAAGGHPFTKINAEDTHEIFLKHASPEQLSYLNPISK